MTNPTEADLARLEADCDAWQRGQITAERVAAIMETDLPALVAYAREARKAWQRAARVLEGLYGSRRPSLMSTKVCASLLALLRCMTMLRARTIIRSSVQSK
jgi:hypothetical protein